MLNWFTEKVALLSLNVSEEKPAFRHSYIHTTDKNTSQVEYKQMETDRDIFKVTDEFTALCFTEASALPAAKCTEILPMTQHA
jgi:hypothetical protein